MIEGYSSEGVTVLINPRRVVVVYRGDTFCNVKMEDGSVHRFRHGEATRVYEALLSADVH